MSNSSRQGGFFAALTCPLILRWPLPCKAGRTTGCNYFALTAPAPTSAKTCYAPAAALATIVLPTFTRSLPADGFGKRYMMVRVKKQDNERLMKDRRYYNNQNKSA
ncbi:hypothetical protein ACFFGT_13395 [Mucilaginibacter angelicae]|uniref:Secreted protein n=1 Tax=Mucilaginibacter angelicae TaxID=869718 RepID=A0ABV6L6X6_9SPHI